MAAVSGKVNTSSPPPSSSPNRKSSPPPVVLVSNRSSSLTPTSHSRQIQIAPQQFPTTTAASPVALPQAQSPTTLWKNLFSDSSSRKSFPAPTFSEEGIPIVQAPPEIILKASEAWKGYILCTFFGTPPPPKKIYTDLNPIWGKNGDITVRHFSEGSCLIFIPSIRTRQWVLDVGFWSAGTVAFSTAEWSSSSKLHSSYLSSAPLWLTFSDIPPQLWSPDCIRLIASGVGSPIPSSRLPLSPSSLGSARIRVLVNLEKPLPPAVVVRDSDGNSARITVDYGRLPPLCSLCSKFGHSDHRCPSPRRSVPASASAAASVPASASIPSAAPASPSVPSAPDPAVSASSVPPPFQASDFPPLSSVPLGGSPSSVQKYVPSYISTTQNPILPKNKASAHSITQPISQMQPVKNISAHLQAFDFLPKPAPLTNLIRQSSSISLTGCKPALPPKSNLNPPVSVPSSRDASSSSVAAPPPCPSSPPSPASSPSPTPSPPPPVPSLPSAISPPASFSPSRSAASFSSALMIPPVSPAFQQPVALSPAAPSSDQSPSFVTLMLRQQSLAAQSPPSADTIHSPLLSRPILKSLLHSPPQQHLSFHRSLSPDASATEEAPPSDSALLLEDISTVSSLQISPIPDTTLRQKSLRPRSSSNGKHIKIKSSKDSRRHRLAVFPPTKRLFLS